MLLDDVFTDDQWARAWRMLWRRLVEARDHGTWMAGRGLAMDVGRTVGLDGVWILTLLDEAADEGLVERAYMRGDRPAWQRAHYRAEVGCPRRERRPVTAQGSGSGPHRPGLR